MLEAVREKTNLGKRVDISIESTPDRRLRFNATYTPKGESEISKIGYASLKEIPNGNRPRKLYHLEYLQVSSKYRGEGVAAAIMSKVEEYIVNTNSVAYLQNAAASDTPIYDINTQLEIEPGDMYERRGWARVPGSPFMYYNLQGYIVL